MNTGSTGTAPASVLIFWDYDTQWAADRSRNRSRVPDWGAREFPNTDRLLDIHARYDIPACFAVVGAAALAGERPYHDPAQVRRIHEAGHEVASHSMRHEWLPALDGASLRETLRASKEAIEQCIGHEVVSFVPPYNQPFDHAAAWSFSVSERLEARGQRTDVRRLCLALAETGYRFCRLAFRSVVERVAELASPRLVRRPEALRTIGGVRFLRLNTDCGFTEDVRRSMESLLPRGGYWLLYGHPHSADDGDGPQSRVAFERMLGALDGWRRDGRIRVTRPRDVLTSEGIR